MSPKESNATRAEDSDDWSAAERWAWEEIRAGRVANFNQRYGATLDPTKPEDWDSEAQPRRLSSAFLEAMVLRKPSHDAVPSQGVRIDGAIIEDPVNLPHARLDYQLWLDNCRLPSGLDLTGIRMDDWLSLEGSWVAKLSMAHAEIDGGLNLKRLICKESAFLPGIAVGRSVYASGASFENGVTLRGATIGGQFDLDSAELGEESDLYGVNVGALFFARGTRFGSKTSFSCLKVGTHMVMDGGVTFGGDVDLGGASVGGRLLLDGVTVHGAVNMTVVEVGDDLSLGEKSSFEGDVVLREASIGGSIVARGSTFAGFVDLNGVRVERSLLMSGGATFRDKVDLRGARIGRQVVMHGSVFDGIVNLDSLKAGNAVFMSDGAEFQGDVRLNLANIGAQLVMDRATFRGEVVLHGLQVEDSLFMRYGATFERQVIMRGGTVGGQFSMLGATFKRPLTLERLSVGGELFMSRKAAFMASVNILSCRIGRFLDLSDADVGVINLTGTHIDGELRLGHSELPPTHWRDGGTMILRNTHAGVVQDRVGGGGEPEFDAWPRALQLDGFTYDRLGGFSGDGKKADMMGRGAKWFEQWLKRDETYSPQPYIQLASVLRGAGYANKANAVLYAGRVRERHNSRGTRYFGLLLLERMIGYGIGAGYFRAVGWGVLFWALGCLSVIAGWACTPAPDGFTVMWASFDLLLPIVTLNESHYDLIDGGCMGRLSLAYLYLHKIIGFGLASVLVAGFAGLTQGSERQ